MGAIRHLAYEQLSLDIDKLSKKQKYVYDIHKNNDDKCWVTIAKKKGVGKNKEFTQWHHKTNEIIENAETILAGNDIYMSLNSFYSTYRRTEYLRQLNCLFLDIDCYSVGMSKQECKWYIDSILFDTQIPYPSKLIDSGNGFYLIWQLKPTPGQALPLWNVLQRYLYEQFKSIGADKAALDCTRVLRVIDTNNTKNGIMPVKIDYEQEVWGPYELRELQRQCLPELTEEVKKEHEQKKNKPKKTTKKGFQVKRLYKLETLYYYRTLDIIKICELREWDLQGSREVILFLYRLYALKNTGDKAEALDRALELNSQFLEPLQEREVIKATRSAERKSYKYENETLIELLGITEEEQNHLLTIISDKEKRLRDYSKRKIERRNEEGLTKREQSKLDKYNQVKELYKQGLKQVEIKEITGFSKSYISEIVKELKSK